MAGVTPSGFEKKTVESIQSELVQDAQSIWGSGLNLEDSTPDGIFIAQMAEAFGDLWDVAEETYNAFFPSQSTGTNLSQLVEINDITRLTAEPTEVTLEFVGDIGYIIEAGTEFTNVTESVVVATTADLELTGTNDSVLAENVVTGPVQIPADTITTMVVPVNEITSLTNPADGIAGNDLETDPQLRTRRDLSISKPSTSGIESITADIINLKGVTHVTTYENYTPNPTFIPANSTMSVVNGGDPEEIAKAINANKSIGIPTEGSESITLTDSQGVTKEIKFQRPTQVPIYVTVNLTIVDSNEYQGDAAVVDSIMSYVNRESDYTSFNVGEDVYQSRLYSPINEIPGHVVDSLFIGIAPNPTSSSTIPIDFQEISDWDESRIIVNS